MSGEISLGQDGELSESQMSWIDAKPAVAGKILVQYAKGLESRLETRVQNYEIYAAVYSEQLETNLRPSRRRRLSQPAATRNTNLTFNLARSLCETEHANITEAEPRPTFVTEDGNRDDQDKARELQAAIDGIMSDLRGYDIFARCELDKCVLGTGVTKIHAINGRPAIERVLVSDILIDEDLMGPGEDPSQVIHRMEIPRAAMLVYAMSWKAPKRVLDAIRSAPSLVSSNAAGKRSDLIAVYDACSLPIDEEHPGRRALAIENFEELIHHEEWKAPRLPYVFQRWQRPTTGFYGIGIVEQVIGIQIEINKFYRNISRALTRWGGVTCLVPTLAKLDTQLWTNSPDGKFIGFDGSGGQPIFMNGPKLSPEDRSWLEWQIENGYRVTGIPQTSAFAEREQGIPSAEGQRQISKKAASRLNPQSKQYERAIVDGAWLLDDVIRKLKEENAKLVISSASQGALHKVDIDAAISLSPGTYKIDVFAGNLLSRHPATRQEQLLAYGNSGVFEKDEVRSMLSGSPDIQAAIGKRPDLKGMYQRQIKRALKDGTYTRPEEYWAPHLPMGVQLYSDALFEAQSDGVADERLKPLREFLQAARDILDPPPEVGPDGLSVEPAPAPAPAEPMPADMPPEQPPMEMMQP